MTEKGRAPTRGSTRNRFRRTLRPRWDRVLPLLAVILFWAALLHWV